MGGRGDQDQVVDQPKNVNLSIFSVTIIVSSAGNDNASGKSGLYMYNDVYLSPCFPAVFLTEKGSSKIIEEKHTQKTWRGIINKRGGKRYNSSLLPAINVLHICVV